MGRLFDSVTGVRHARDLRVLVACEESGAVRRAFGKLGVDAWSCDIVPSRDGSQRHITGDAFIEAYGGDWDVMIAFPPCTHLASSGARWFAEKRADGRQQEAIDFARALWEAPVPHIALENPVGILSTHLGKPTQIVQPWQYGHGETKATCLWLKGLPTLNPTNIVEGREQRVWKMGPSPTRQRDRSETFAGIAEAMAVQWTQYLLGTEVR